MQRITVQTDNPGDQVCILGLGTSDLVTKFAYSLLLNMIAIEMVALLVNHLVWIVQVMWYKLSVSVGDEYMTFLWTGAQKFSHNMTIVHFFCEFGEADTLNASVFFHFDELFSFATVVLSCIAFYIRQSNSWMIV